MLLPLLLIGVVAFLAGKASVASSPAIGALGPGAPVGPHSASSPSQSVRFELGRPYRIVATAELPIAQLQKLIRWLALGSYRASAVTVRTRPVPPGSRCIPSHELTVTFNAPKTESVALGRPVLWDLGDGKAEVIVRRVDRLDGAPLAIGASPSRRLRELRAQAKAELALGKKLGRPLGPIYAEAMQRAMDLSARYGVPLFVAARGRYAREMISRKRPRAVVAVACERDLVSGVRDVAGRLPVLGTTLSLPDGPCKNTGADIEALEGQIRTFLGLDARRG